MSMLRLFLSHRSHCAGFLAGLAVFFLLCIPLSAFSQSIPIVGPISYGTVSGFGEAVATCVTSDGNAWYFVHSPTEAKVYVYKFDASNTWVASGTLTVDPGILTAGGIFTFNKTIAADKDFLVVGEPAASGFGGVRTFHWSGSAWTTGFVISSVASGYRGAAVDISGNYIVVGLPEYPNLGGSVEIYNTSGTLVQSALLTRSALGDEERFGTSVAIDGNRIVVGAPYYGDRVGRAYSYKFNGSSFVYEKTFGSAVAGTNVAVTGPANFHFAYSVDVSKNRIVVGAPVADLNSIGNIGGIWIYSGSDSAWTRDYSGYPQSVLTGEQAGYSVSIYDSVVFTGAPYHKVLAETWGGGVFIYKLGNNGWTEDQSIFLPSGTISNGWVNRFYGFSVSYGPNGYLAVGAPGASGKTGSAFVYEFVPRPTGVSATDGPSDSVVVSWTKRATPMTARIYKGLSPNYPFLKEESSNNSTIDQSGNYWAYYDYLVTMKNSFGESQFRMDQGRRTSGVQSPIFASDGSYTDKITVGWNLPANFFTTGIDGFHVYRKKSTDANFTLLVSVGKTAFSYSDFGVEPDPVQYVYSVRPYQGLIEGPSVSDQGYRKKAITSIAASDGTYLNKVHISWSGVTGATSYKVYRDLTLLTTTTSIAYDDTNGAPGTAYKYSVLVIGSGFTSSDSAADNGGRFSAAPIVTASDGVYSDGVHLSWIYTSKYETGLRIIRRDLNTTQLDTIVAPVGSSIIDDKAQYGTMYEYCVEAFNASVKAKGCDAIGWRTPNGTIEGSVLTGALSGSEGVFVYANNPFAHAFSFDGNGDSIVATGIALGNSSFSIECWAKRNVLNTNNSILGQGSNTTNKGLNIGFRAGNQLTFSFWNNDLDGPPDTSLAWHHWACTYNGATGQRIIYRDGEVYASATTTTYAYQGSGTFAIGKSPSGSFTGLIDEVRVWRGVRTQDDITRNAGRLLTDTTGLIVYYPMDVAAGTVVPDYSQKGRHGTIYNATPTTTVAPVYNGNFTNASGSYSITKIAYGESQQFTIAPRKISPGTPSSILRTILPGDTISTVHSFSPTSIIRTLQNGGSVSSSADFSDLTSFTMSGVIQYLDLGNQSASGICFSKDVSFTVNELNEPTLTDDQGHYAISRAPGSYVIVPVKSGHVFSPPSYTVNTLNQNFPSINFEDQTKAKLTLRAAGGCDASIGTVKILLESVNLCFRETVAVNGSAVVEVPPLNYNATVVVVSSGNPEQDLAIKEYFNSKGSKPVDLSAVNTSTGFFEDTLDFIYRSPAFVEVLGFPPSQSVTLPPPLGSAINVPVLHTLNDVNLTVRVFERYINNGDTSICPVKNAMVKIHNDITGDSPEDSLRVDTLGQANYRLVPGLPNIGIGGAHPLQKRFEAVASVDGQFPSTEQWALVLGERPRTATFTTVTPELPLMVLHDPPGDQSSSFIEQGQDACATWSMYAEEASSRGQFFKASFGTKYMIIEGLGVMTAQETEEIADVSAGLTVSQSLKGGYENEICVGVTERFSTDEGDIVTGPRSDVFIGGAVNLIYALTDVLKLEGSTVLRDTNFAVGVDGFATKYIYTEAYIREKLIPNLEIIKGLKQTEGNTYGADSLENAIHVWQQVLDQNVENKASAEFIENRSFDAGANVEYSKTSTRSESHFIDFNLAVDAEVAAEIGFEIAGVGVTSTSLINFRMETGFTKSSATTTSTTVGYNLGDDDPGDVFSVNIKKDKQFGTVVFDLVGGTTSCPWEPWIIDPEHPNLPRTQRRSNPELTVSPGERNNVDPDGIASFTLNLTNLSESGELWIYTVAPMQSSNPDGATIRINGESAPVFVVDPGVTQQATLTVKRGPEAFIYENLKVLVYNQCDYNIFANGGPFYNVDTATVTVRFQQACSEIRIAEPVDGWIVNRSNNNILPIAMADFNLAVSDLDEIAMQYARETDQTWTNVPQATFVRNPDGSWQTQDGTAVTLSGTVYAFPWQIPAGLPDGHYKLRAVTRCKTLGSFYSSIIRGTVDRTTPLVFGHPWPTDGILSTGDDIKVEFTEFVDCASLTSDRFEMRDAISGVRIPVDFLCNFNGTQVVLTPRGVSMDEMRGKTYQMTIPGAVPINNVERGVRDLYGNVMQKSVSWAFYAGDSAITWESPSAVTALNVGEGGIITTSIHNAGTEPIEFTIDSLPSWLVVTPPSGVIPAGGSLPITLTISGTIGVGDFEALIFATTIPSPALAKGSVASTQASSPARIPLTVAVNVGAGSAPLSWSPTSIASAAQQGQSTIINATLNNLGSDTLAVDLSGLPSWLGTALLHQLVTPKSSWPIAFTMNSTLAKGTYTATVNASTASGAMALPVYVIVNETGTNIGNQVVQAVNVPQGWSWISLGVDVTGKNIDTILASIRDSSMTGDLIAGEEGSSQYSSASGAWIGSVGTLAQGKSYHLYRSKQDALSVPGVPVNPSTPISVGAGWNYLGYLPLTPIAVGQALASLNPTGSSGDVLKGAEGSMMYFPADGQWYGGVANFSPGEGYRLYRKNGGSLSYVNAQNTPEGISRATSGNVQFSKTEFTTERTASISQALQYRVEPTSFAYSMTIAAAIAEGNTISGTNHQVLLAYVGSELRGVGPLVRIPSIDQYRSVITVYGNIPAGEGLTFRLADDATPLTYALQLDQPVSFKADTIIGTIQAPRILQVNFGAASTQFLTNISPEWNMIALPLALSNRTKSAIFPGAVSPAFRFDRGLGYLPDDTLDAGSGYWIRYTAAGTVLQTGTAIDSLTVALGTDWNLIGGISVDVPVPQIIQDPPNSLASVFFGFGPSGYLPDSVVKAGKAYWVRTTQDCRITLQARLGANVPAAGLTNISRLSASELPPSPPLNGGVTNEPISRRKPVTYSLDQNFPNPFNPLTIIRYGLPAESHVTLDIYNVLGQVVTTLINGVQPAGYESVNWDASTMASGMYYYRLEVTNTNDPTKRFIETKKMLLVR